jgi:AhpD family alkylhydroperoxidase
MSNFPFPDHTLDPAPPGSRRAMAATTARLEYLPAALARLASSPQLMDGFLKASGLFENTTLDPLARECLIMTVAVRHGCHVCVAMHTASLTRMGAGADLIAALRDGRPVPDEGLAAIQAFTHAVLDTAGAVSDKQLDSFLGYGDTPRSALEVVLGIGAYTMSTLANRMTRAPVDDRLRAFA